MLKLAAGGLGNKEIASALGLSLPTVKAHFVNIFNKMSVGSRTEAVLHALRKGWISMEDVTSGEADAHRQQSAEGGPHPWSPL